MGRLLEVDYEKIFSPKTMTALKGKSGQSLQQMLGDKNLMQALTKSKAILDEIIAAEDGYRDELEMVAAQMVTDAYPIIDYANIKIDAKIVGLGDLNIQPGEGEVSIDNMPETEETEKAKRRIINGITQGASIRGAFGFMLFREYLNQINPALVDKYSEILKLAFGIYDDENAIAMMLAALEQGAKMQGGESEMEYDEENNQFVIKAKAICFPMLVHEIVKGLYEIVGTEGFGADKEKNQAIVGAVDKLSNEPRDLQYGKFIYDAISKIYNESNIDDPRVRELFFAEVYKLIDDEFFPFVENAINDELKPLQKKWAVDTMNDIKRDLMKDDTGLADLDETL
jgi:predicted lipoprotein